MKGLIAGGIGGGIKSIQRGVISPTATQGATSITNVAISNVDMSKSLLTINCITQNHRSSDSSTSSTFSRLAYATLDSSTNVKFTVIDSSSSYHDSPTIAWELVEYY